MNKFNIGDEAILEHITKDIEVKIIGVSTENGEHYHVRFKDHSSLWYNVDSLRHIEQDTKEDTPTDEEIETDTSYEDTPKQKESLDYEKEYKLLLEEYEDVNEELYIAKTAIKMLSELI
jgi:hypothetical protein